MGRGWWCSRSASKVLALLQRNNLRSVNRTIQNTEHDTGDRSAALWAERRGPSRKRLKHVALEKVLAGTLWTRYRVNGIPLSLLFEINSHNRGWNISLRTVLWYVCCGGAGHSIASRSDGIRTHVSLSCLCLVPPRTHGRCWRRNRDGRAEV